MTGERSWEDLIKELEKMKELGPPEAIWFATQGSEDSGIWLLRPEGDPLRSRFSLFAASAIAKLGIPPAAVPEPEEYCPHWRASCEAEQELARKKGISLDLSDAVPYGLGKVDEDAVDGCTRAWLELLRQERHAFRIPRYGTETIKGQQYKTLKWRHQRRLGRLTGIRQQARSGRDWRPIGWDHTENVAGYRGQPPRSEGACGCRQTARAPFIRNTGGAYRYRQGHAVCNQR
jgi:hypothetical protein